MSVALRQFTAKQNGGMAPVVGFFRSKKDPRAAGLNWGIPQEQDPAEVLHHVAVTTM
jgi:hypothetical protein